MQTKRSDAVRLLAKLQLPTLNKEQREELLLGWWQDDPCYFQSRIPQSLILEISAGDRREDANSPTYNPLLLVALCDRLYGMRNDYIIKEISKYDINIDNIDGDPEPMLKCPCCQYLSLKERGEYEICPVCFWEDDGTDIISALSVPNRMTLETGRNNFSMIGTSKPQYLNNSTSKQRFEKYLRTDIS